MSAGEVWNFESAAADEPTSADCGRCGAPVSSLLVDGVQLLAGLEADGLARWNVDFGAGTRIAADAGLARTDVEDAETAKLDAIALRKCLFHRLEDDFHRALGLRLGDAGPAHDFVDNIELDHAAAPID